MNLADLLPAYASDFSNFSRQDLQIKHRIQDHELPVVFLGVLQGKLLELLIHLSVKVVSEEEGPESEEGVHLLRLTHT